MEHTSDHVGEPGVGEMAALAVARSHAKWDRDADAIEWAQKRIAALEGALVAIIDAVDAKDQAAIDTATFVGRGLTF